MLVVGGPHLDRHRRLSRLRPQDLPGRHAGGPEPGQHQQAGPGADLHLRRRQHPLAAVPHADHAQPAARARPAPSPRRTWPPTWARRATARQTWTYHLKSDIFFEDGTPITSADVKYGIERSFAPELPGGAPYLRDWLVDAANYQGPYKDPNGIAAIETPDAKTIIFHLRKPEGDFPLLATATQFAPVPKAKDTGVDYDKHPISSGPYMIASYDKGKTLDLVRNPHWSAASDPLRYACPDKIDVTSGLDPAVINQRIATGSRPGRERGHHRHHHRPGPAGAARTATPRWPSGWRAGSSRRRPTWRSTPR